jgi:23S rRNA U2552 (ribose-2'-O)-methylase RlmE/FtsJ
MGALWSEFITHHGRPMQKWAEYFPAYEAHFERFVDRPMVMWEIGVADGGSMQLWRRYFGPRAQIVGLDVVDHRELEEDQVAIRVGDQSDPAVLDGLLDEFGPPDIVLDDGSHYWPEAGGGLGKPDSFIEISKDLIDSLNADHTRGDLEPNDFTRSTTSIHFYDSMVVFERGKRGPNRNIQFGYA